MLTSKFGWKQQGSPPEHGAIKAGDCRILYVSDYLSSVTKWVRKSESFKFALKLRLAFGTQGSRQVRRLQIPALVCSWTEPVRDK